MATMLHPGVYIREIPSGVRTIEGIPTSITIFLGETERGPLGVTRINGRTEYSRIFGGYRRRLVGQADPVSGRLLMPYSLDGYFSNGGTSAYILRLCDGFNVLTDTTETAFRTEAAPGVQEFIEASSPGAWGNSVRVAAALSTDSTAATDRFRMRLAVFYTPPGSTTLGLVEEFDRLSLDPQDENYVVDVLGRSSYIRWREDVDPFVPGDLDDDTINPRFPTAAELGASAVALAGGSGGDGLFDVADMNVFLTDRLQEVDDAALMVAASSRMLSGESTASEFVAFENEFITYVDNRPRQDLFFVGELPSLAAEADSIAEAREWANGTGGNAPPSSATTFNAVYWPHLRVADPAGIGRNPIIVVPPGGYVAGIYARTDGRRGVWKAPAGVEALFGGVQSFSFDVLDVHQDSLNPLGINALRRIPSAGLVVWGARTRQPSSEWRYIPVRREAIFLRGSIYNSIQWAVFEPNDEGLWQSLRNTVGAFMEIQFRNGAFAGQTSRDAYFVKVDSETTTPDDQAAGIVNILVGFAPLRPAEFVVVSLQQIAGRSR